jgi:hypothetical protein
VARRTRRARCTAYGEHDVVEVEVGGRKAKVGGAHFRVRLAAGAGARLTLRMRRYANQPTLAFPWDAGRVLSDRERP